MLYLISTENGLEIDKVLRGSKYRSKGLIYVICKVIEINT